MKNFQSESWHKTFLNSIRLDSLKLRIPISIIDILDDSILAHYIEVNESTGELTPEYYSIRHLVKILRQISVPASWKHSVPGLFE
jgi:hypothetical protein